VLIIYRILLIRLTYSICGPHLHGNHAKAPSQPITYPLSPPCQTVTVLDRYNTHFPFQRDANNPLTEFSIMSKAQGDYSHCVDVDLEEEIGSLQSKINTDKVLGQLLEDDKDKRSIASTVQRWYGKVVNPIRRMLIPIHQKLRRCFHGTSWRFGLFAGIYTSLVVLLANTTMLIFGCFVHGGYVDGIATIAQGNIHDMEWIITLYHVFINVFSTVLLTSSNYTMQLLCAPTRKEIDEAHQRGQWIDIGLMSFYNLRHINKRRVMLWAALALSSVPLHLL
jgi:hypothetical protein